MILIIITGFLSIVSGAARAGESFTVILDWFVNPDHAPLFVAQERGYFVQHGLEVEMIAPADPNDPPKLVAAGQADIYPRIGRTMEWDTAAGHAIVHYAGGNVTDMDGNELQYGNPGFENPHFIVKGPGVAKATPDS